MSWSDMAPLYGHFGTDWIAMEATETTRSSNSSYDSARPIPPSGSSSRRTESPPQSSDFPPRRGSFQPVETTPDLPIARTIPSTIFRLSNSLQIPSAIIPAAHLLLWHRQSNRSSNGSELLHFGFGQHLAATLSVSISDGEESGTKLLDDSSPALVSNRNEGLALLSKLLLVVSTTKTSINCKWPASSDSARPTGSPRNQQLQQQQQRGSAARAGPLGRVN